MANSFASTTASIGYVATQGVADRQAFLRAVRLARREGAPLRIYGLAEIPPRGLIELLGSYGIDSAYLRTNEERLAAMQRLAREAEEAGVAATAEVLSGHPYSALQQAIQAEGLSMLIKAAEPQPVATALVFGRLDRRLIRKCPCPIWIDNTIDIRPVARVLAAVDPAPFEHDPYADPTREQLNALVMDQASRIARTLDAEFEVAHVWDFPFESALAHRAGLATETLDQVGAAIRQKHQEALSRLVTPFRTELHQTHLVKGVAGVQIAKLAAEREVDLVVLGTICRAGISGMLLGNTCETVMELVNCGLLVIKPPGFVEPRTD